MKLRKLFTVLLIVIIVLLVIPTTVSALSVNQNSNENSIETPLFTEEELESFFKPERINYNENSRSWASVSYSNATIFTTDGTSVPARIYQDMTTTVRQAFNDYISSKFTNITKIAEPTYRYNCHAFAWYYQDQTLDEVSNYNSTSTVYFTQYPQKFMDDSHTIPVSSNSVSVGDIVVYWRVEETDENGEGELEPVHSAIVYSISSNGEITCISKWGYYGLYIHELENLPEGYLTPSGANCTYYRYTQGEHKLFEYINTDAACHTVQCGLCDYCFYEEHTPDASNSICTKCLRPGPFATIMKKAVPAILPQPNRESEYLPKE